MIDPGSTPKNRTQLFIGVAVVLVAGLAAAVIAINSTSHKAPLAVVNLPTPTPFSGAEPTVPAGTTDSTPCAGKSFSSHLAPLNQPADVHTYAAAPTMTIDTSKLYRATIVTAKGNIIICLQPSLAPITVNNFVTLARNHFYDGLIFHRVVANFVVQGGDPQGTGNGGPGYQFADETVKAKYVAGAVAMANSGPNTNGSQFFIDTVDDTQALQPLYNLFGNVESGLDVAGTITQGDAMTYVLVDQQK